MPASRSRTEHWRESLQKIQERHGALEISVARPSRLLPSHGTEVPQPGSDIVWRVALISVGEDEMVVESPAAFGETIGLGTGVELIGAMSVGQNRWMFHTRTLGSRQVRGPSGGGTHLVLALPEGVERCTRRHFYRISTADLQLPDVQCWPLLNPATVVAAEAANRVQIESLMNSAPAAEADAEPLLLPDVGPSFTSKLVNISGGGLGLRIGREEAGAMDRKPYVWLRVDLRPHIPAPIAVTARVAHAHIDSGQNLYVGLAFDFAHNPAHRAFVIERFTTYLIAIQRQQQGEQAVRAG